MPRETAKTTEVPRSPLLTPDQASEYLSVSRSLLFELVRQGELVKVKIGRCTRFTIRDLDDFIAVKRKEQIAKRASRGRGLS